MTTFKNLELRTKQQITNFDSHELQRISLVSHQFYKSFSFPTPHRPIIFPFVSVTVKQVLD